MVIFFFFFKQKTAYEIGVRLVGSEMCIRDRSIMDEQFMTYGSAKVMLANVTFNQADSLVDSLENVDGVKEVAFDDSSDHFKGTNALFDITFSGTSDEQVSKDALNSVKDILADYDVYVSTEVGSEESSAESLAKDMLSLIHI